MSHDYAGPEDRIHKVRAARFYDQHDRKFSATVDKKNGSPIGNGPQPSGWRPPWMPTQEWFRYFEQDDPTRFRIDYDAMLQDRIAAHEQYDREWNDFAVAQGWDPKDEDKAGRIIAKVGKRPQPIELVVAAMQGNKYILGLTAKVDERIVPFLRQRPVYQRAAKKQEVLASMDFTDHDDDEDLEERMDLQEQFDPEATPRGVVKNKGGRPKRTVTAGEAV